jgi:hypothetical protein
VYEPDSVLDFGVVWLLACAVLRRALAGFRQHLVWSSILGEGK